MPYEVFRMEWCLEHGWRPDEFDEFDAMEMARWQAMLTVKQSEQTAKQREQKAKEHD